MNTKRILTWVGFVVVIVLVVWGLVAAEKKARTESAAVGPVDEVSSTDRVSSSTSTPVTLIEYSDFQCPACAAYFPIVEKLLSENPETVRLVYRHFPLAQHANAVPAARAAEAAGLQGKFWEMYRMLFSTQAEWENSSDASAVFEGYASSLGLDMDKYRSDLESPVVVDKVNNDMKGGLKARVDSTPTFYVNGNKINNPQSYEEFKAIIDQAAISNS